MRASAQVVAQALVEQLAHAFLKVESLFAKSHTMAALLSACESEPSKLVAAFLAIADAAQGAVVVHCKAGLGRTGTLIAVYMMRSHGFTAREAMGWLRIMRPGSVIGEQQDYLCAVEREIAAALAATAASRCGVLPPLGGETARAAPPTRRMVRQASEDSATLARQVADAARRRAATQRRDGAMHAATAAQGPAQRLRRHHRSCRAAGCASPALQRAAAAGSGGASGGGPRVERPARLVLPP